MNQMDYEKNIRLLTKEFTLDIDYGTLSTEAASALVDSILQVQSNKSHLKVNRKLLQRLSVLLSKHLEPSNCLKCTKCSNISVTVSPSSNVRTKKDAMIQCKLIRKIDCPSGINHNKLGALPTNHTVKLGANNLKKIEPINTSRSLIIPVESEITIQKAKSSRYKHLKTKSTIHKRVTFSSNAELVPIESKQVSQLTCNLPSKRLLPTMKVTSPSGKQIPIPLSKSPVMEPIGPCTKANFPKSSPQSNDYMNEICDKFETNHKLNSITSVRNKTKNNSKTLNKLDGLKNVKNFDFN